nr:YtzH-like family protein [Evansella caseinilytica]
MNYHHQLQLLLDILQNQQTESYGTHDEFAQIERLASDLLHNQAVPQEIKNTLNGVEQYAYHHDRDGLKSQLSIPEIQQWVDQLKNSEQRF